MHKLTVKQLKGLDKLTGLVNTKKPFPVYFETRWGIHTFGMKYPIDVLILDKENRVVKVRENLEPNKIFLWNPKYNRVAELPAGTINKLKIALFVKIKLIAF